MHIDCDKIKTAYLNCREPNGKFSSNLKKLVSSMHMCDVAQLANGFSEIKYYVGLSAMEEIFHKYLMIRLDKWELVKRPFRWNNVQPDEMVSVFTF